MMLINSINRNIRFDPKMFSRSFGVNLFFSERDRPDERVEFKTKVVYCGEHDTETYYLDLYKFDFSTSTDYMGEHSFSILRDAFLSLYPFTVIVNSTGCIRGVAAFGIAGRWQAVKDNLQKRYVGSEVETFLSSMEDLIVSDKGIAYQAVMADFFFSHLLQFRYEWSKGTSSKESFVVSSPILPYKAPILFRVSQVTEQSNLVDEISIKVRQEGKLLHSGKYRDLFFGDTMDYSLIEQEINGNLTILYELDSDTYLINSMEGIVELSCGKTSLYKTRITAYFLDENIVEATPSKYQASSL